MTKVMLDRLRAESDSDHLRASFQAFDVLQMFRGMLDRQYDDPAEDNRNSTRTACLRGLRRLADAMKVDADCAVLEYIDVSLAICSEVNAAGLTAPDNREQWRKVLSTEWLDKHFADRVAPIVNLQSIVRFYLSVLDGECQVERDLGSVLCEASEHCNLQIDGVDDLMFLKLRHDLQGPTSFGRLDRQGNTTLTDFTKTCLKLWREKYGCRYGSYDSHPRVQKRQKKEHTWTQLKGDVFTAAHARTLLSSRAVPWTPYSQGFAPAGPVDTDSYCTPRHIKFTERTAKKRRDAKQAMEKRRFGENPFPVPLKSFSGPVMHPVTMRAVTKVALLVANQPEAGLTAVSVETGEQRCNAANLVVTDSLGPLLKHQRQDGHEMSVTDAIYIVGLGRIVTSTESWQDAGGDPKRLAQQQLVHHKAMAQKSRSPVEITFSKALKQARPEVYKAVKVCCKAWRSKWRMKEACLTAPEVGQWFGDEQDIWVFLRGIREVINYRGPKLAKQATGLNWV